MIRMKLLLPEHAPSCATHATFSDFQMLSVAVSERRFELGVTKWYVRYEIAGFACCEEAMLDAAREQVHDFFGNEDTDRLKFTIIH